ncbi:8270_t:CDS:1, partial [Gigaspora margarita]
AIKENSSSTLKSRENNSPILESRENNSPTLESHELKVRILSAYAIGAKNEESHFPCTAGFWVRQQGLAYLVTSGHCALNATKDPQGYVEFYFKVPGTDQTSFFGKMTRLEIEPVDRGFILPFDEYSEYPFIYSHELQTPMFAITDFTRTPVNFAEGAVLCKSGASTGYSCGRVTSGSVKSILSNPGYGLFEYDNQIEVSTRCTLGDSGAPVFSYNNPLDLSRTGVNLIGMMVGGKEDENIIVITPLYQILDSDMDVVTI